PWAIITPQPNASVLGMGATAREAWADASAQAGEGHFELDGFETCVRGSDIALRAWENSVWTDSADHEDARSVVYVTADGTVDVVRCTPETPCGACDGCLNDVDEDDEDDEDAPVERFWIQLDVSGEDAQPVLEELLEGEDDGC